MQERGGKHEQGSAAKQRARTQLASSAGASCAEAVASGFDFGDYLADADRVGLCSNFERHFLLLLIGVLLRLLEEVCGSKPPFQWQQSPIAAAACPASASLC